VETHPYLKIARHKRNPELLIYGLGQIFIQARIFGMVVFILFRNSELNKNVQGL
jgi:hypothetical protein